MPLEPTTVRFAPDTMKIVRAGAQTLGVSVSQFVREAAIVRAVFALDDGERRALRVELDRIYASEYVQRMARRSA